MTRGGKTVFGASVGILMLETQFPRIPGDIGNALTWPFPVHYKVVPGATPDNIVRGDPWTRAQDFIKAGKELVAMGCDGVATNCGFLALLQDEMKEALGVPVATSSLIQAPMISAILPPGKHMTILTISADTLTRAHLDAAGVPEGTPVVGTEGGREFTRAVLGDEIEINFEAARADMLEAAEALVTSYPDTGAILLECTNMVPYAADIRHRSGLPVYSVYSLLTWFHAGLTPRRFPVDLDDPRP
ncbi:aspartate/glutamate racemase family protein [Jannaschia sp. CCS1]|uniref:aspartate/glutamate racemase family protein n=1 Tax=Jannaschia sp. (strain CCS1) TaxID=290400 RepID=UPI000053BAC5|nr:aspartate/glutamate racemase family protein [Jannaschia sp. CCS1]ABD54321.1 hypothetical protein Jann_1404 [Jannaschia sp. CCS1]